MEYQINGYFFRSSTDEEGYHSTFYVTLARLHKDLGRTMVERELDVFEGDMPSYRDAALDALDAAAVAAATTSDSP